MMLKIIHWKKAGWWDFSGDQLLKAATKKRLAGILYRA
jgi:hypothetical protein